MTILFRMTVFIISAVILSTSLYSAEKEAKALAIVTAVIGDVQTQSFSSGKFVKAVKGAFLYEGDSIKVGSNSKASIFFIEGNEIRIAANTQVTLEGKDTAASLDDNSSMSVASGKIWAKFLKLEKGTTIRTPAASCAVKGTEFEVNVLNELNTEVTVIEGLLELKNKMGSVLAGASTKTSISAAQPPPPPQKIDLKQRESWESEVEKAGSLPEKKELILKLKAGEKEEEIRIEFKKK